MKNSLLKTVAVLFASLFTSVFALSYSSHVICINANGSSRTVQVVAETSLVSAVPADQGEAAAREQAFKAELEALGIAVD